MGQATSTFVSKGLLQLLIQGPFILIFGSFRFIVGIIQLLVFLVSGR
jgi:hypothetical protein